MSLPKEGVVPDARERVLYRVILQLLQKCQKIVPRAWEQKADRLEKIPLISILLFCNKFWDSMLLVLVAPF